MFLYHYTTEKNALLYILNTKKLLFGKIQNTSDPRENRPFTPTLNITTSFSLRFDGYEKVALPFTDKELNINFHDHYKVQIICFCLDKNNPKKIFDYGFSKPRMWAQYAENHKGCCLIFDKEKFDNEFNKIKLIKKSRKVSYILNEKNHSFDLNLDFNDIANNLCEKKFHRLMEKNSSHILFRKSPDWKEEREFRYMIINPKQDDYFIDISESLKGIIFSHGYNLHVEDVIYNKCKELKIDLFRLNWKNGVPYKFDFLKHKQKEKLKDLFVKLKETIVGTVEDINSISGNDIYHSFMAKFPNKISEKEELVSIINTYYKYYYGDNYLIDDSDNLMERIEKFLTNIEY